ncbi:sulfatase [Verrucomicrobiaceae bacterium N1E253]|uniref:Sulfatase n=1 Tax=Oceaniferula marina TaxID=2748318 RepID=A0A851GGG1_9BACT|nr:sulfatase [Oceaniferula marina]
MRSGIRFLFLLACCAWPLAGSAAGDGLQARKPNVIFILTDDLGYSDLSCYGAKKVKTPHLDKMAQMGMRFTDFHTGANICSPSRAAFLTGAYPQRAGTYMGINYTRMPHWFLGLNPEEITIAEQFKSVGYKTFMIGKWHLGTQAMFHPKKHGFDSYYGLPCNYSKRLDARFWDEDEVLFDDAPLDRLTELYTARAVKVIKENKEEPFFLYLAHNYPHTPYKAGAKWRGSSKDGMRGDVMQELDWGIGEVIHALEEAGISDNTLVIFSSDNGPVSPKYSAPYRGTKYTTLEGGHRVPLILCWPGKVPAKVSDTPVVAMDLFPTLTELMGASMPSDRVYDGVTLTPLFRNEPIARSSSAPFFYYNAGSLQAVRMGQWKLHLPRTLDSLPFWEKTKAFGALQSPMLVDLKQPQSETSRKSVNMPEVRKTLIEEAMKMRAELGDYLQRGSGQRPTGSSIPGVPIVSHGKDWELLVDEETRNMVADLKEKHGVLESLGRGDVPGNENQSNAGRTTGGAGGKKWRKNKK